MTRWGEPGVRLRSARVQRSFPWPVRLVQQPTWHLRLQGSGLPGDGVTGLALSLAPGVQGSDRQLLVLMCVKVAQVPPAQRTHREPELHVLLVWRPSVTSGVAVGAQSMGQAGHRRDGGSVGAAPLHDEWGWSGQRLVGQSEPAPHVAPVPDVGAVHEEMVARSRHDA